MAGEPVNVKEFEELARQALPKMYYDYYAGGAEDQHTLKENVEAFCRIIIRPRILVDVSRIDMSTVILGHKTSAPIRIAPTAMHKLAHSEGEVATARGAAACNVIMGLSYMSTCTIEEVASSCDAVRFFQIYILQDLGLLMRHHLSEHILVSGSGFESSFTLSKTRFSCMLPEDMEIVEKIAQLPTKLDGLDWSKHDSLGEPYTFRGLKNQVEQLMAN